MANYTDGNYTAAFLTDVSIGYPLNVPNNGGTREYTLTYVQYANTYADATIGDTDNNAPNSYLVEQGPVKRIGAGCVEFTRTFAEVPSTWNEAEQTAYTFPGLTYGGEVVSNVYLTWDAYGRRAPITLFALATVTHSYAQGNAPAADNVFVVTDNGNVVDYIGRGNPLISFNSVTLSSNYTSPSTEPATYTISSDVRLWRGNIREKITKTVSKPA